MDEGDPNVAPSSGIKYTKEKEEYDTEPTDSVDSSEEEEGIDPE